LTYIEQGSMAALKWVRKMPYYSAPGVHLSKHEPQTRKRLVEAVKKHDVVFAVGPAGTGKTYIAVALAVRALKNKEIKRIIITRPAVEAGENLGFLPGDLQEKN
jgi:phosphate starvation-inducible protein PhoH and related proteins